MRPALFACFGSGPTVTQFVSTATTTRAKIIASKDTGLLNAMVTVAEERMDLHQKKTGIQCDKVMVFPQGNFSQNAMDVLKAHNFRASVNSGPFPRGEHVSLTLRELIEPAILKYGGFPLFPQKIRA